MNNFREVNENDILKDWFKFREDSIFTMCDADKKYIKSFNDITKNIMQNVPNYNKKYVDQQLNLLDKAFMDYFSYWNEKCYRNGFVDGVELIMGCLEE